VHITLVADVASAYFELLQLDDQLEFLRGTLILREESLDLIQKRLALGATDDYEYQQAQGILESTRASLAALEHQRTVANNRIDFLVGSVGGYLPPGLRSDEQRLDTDLSSALPSTVLLLRPDVMAAELRLKAANANIGVARAALFPKIALSAGFGTLSRGPLSVLDVGTSALSPLLSLPALFDGGRNAAGVDASIARKSIAVAEYERTIQLAFREVSDQLSARASLTAQMRATRANALSQELRLNMAKSRYDLGAIAYFEVIDAQREYLASQQSIASVRRAQAEAAVQLYKALGGGAQSASVH
jgi:multidrug efflux system outer membrane protein